MDQYRINTSQSIITVPSRDKIGTIPFLLVFITTFCSFFFALQPYFYLPSIMLNESMSFPLDILDVLSLMSLPATILFALICNQLKSRLNFAFFNFWSVIETILASGTLICNLIYVLARPEECLQLTQGLDEDSLGEIEKLIEFIKKLGFTKIFDDPESSSAKALMVFCTYTFIAQCCFMLIYTSASCSIYGEAQYVLTIKECNNIYKVVVKHKN